MHVNDPVRQTLMPYSCRQHWLSNASLYRLTSPLVSAPSSAHKYLVLTMPIAHQPVYAFWFIQHACCVKFTTCLQHENVELFSWQAPPTDIDSKQTCTLPSLFCVHGAARWAAKPS